MSDVSKNASMEQHKASQEGLGIGKLITDEQHRDAIHVAIVPMVAGERLSPGDHLRIENGRAYHARAQAIGIADPFLTSAVMQEERFWLFLYPGSITSLRHVWTHPGLDDEAGVTARPVTGKEASEAWLRDFCETADCPDYDTMMEALRTNKISDRDDPDGYPGYYNVRWGHDYLHFGGLDAHGEIPTEFWDHVEIVLGRKLRSTERPAYFSCSC